MPHTAPLAPPAAATDPASPSDDDVPRPRTAWEWRGALDDYRLPAGPDGWWALGSPVEHDRRGAAG